ncbi:SEC-C domain-containing protein [Salicibibacter cibarius]|uniref:SEC-C domain-containing protein n=1 Tax=Salicibibacter cibarius TaxID=2743000 RepID=A0A7T6Z3Z5_9BACI|nr:SEC-C metal-binding domain-containing protein [Salicibibacter cibarius]QQK76479.1 SEC-C domain-containing protein [Salicibibacter cibarius]
MAKIGRNEPCPCGSGKKYKHCCLANKVVDIRTKMGAQELEQLSEDLEDFSLHYTDPIYSLYKAYVHENNWDIDSDYEEEYYLLFVAWAICNAPLIDGETIFQTFMDEQSGALRPETKERIDGWVTVPGMYEVIDHIDDDHFKVVSLETGERDVFCDKEDELPEIGNGVIGIFVPFTNNVNHFLFTYDEFPLELLQSVYEQYRSDLDLARFSKAMKNEYPFVLHDLFNEEADPRKLIDTYDWASKKHQAVIELLYETNRPIWDDEDLNLAIEVWQEFCEDENPVIKKEAVFAAALEYLVNMMDGDGATQKEIAEKYGTSPSTLSQRYQEMNYLMYDFFDDMLDDFSPFDPDTEGASELAEQMFGELKQALESQEFSSEEEIEQFINELLPADLPFGTSEATGDQVDQYVLLAEGADTLEEQNDLYFEGMIKGEAEFGPDFFENNRGLFWGLTETRPYMRAKQGYAETCEQLGALDLAKEHYRELLDLNEMDNQGIRYLLIGALMKAGDYGEAKELVEEYDEPTANMVYSRAYAEYKLNGWTKKTEKWLQEAIDQNLHVPVYLLGKRKIPETIPPFYGLGDENEAIDYAQRYAELWQNDQALLQKLEALV